MSLMSYIFPSSCHQHTRSWRSVSRPSSCSARWPWSHRWTSSSALPQIHFGSVNPKWGSIFCMTFSWKRAIKWYIFNSNTPQNSWVVRWCTYPLEDVNSYVDNCYIATQDRELFSSQTSREPAHSHDPSLAQASRCGWNPRTPTPHQWRRERPSCRSQRPQKTTSCKKINI